MNDKRDSMRNLGGADAPHFTVDVEQSEQPAWEEVAAGRFMPRRVRGSFQGRALG